MTKAGPRSTGDRAIKQQRHKSEATETKNLWDLDPDETVVGKYSVFLSLLPIMEYK